MAEAGGSQNSRIQGKLGNTENLHLKQNKQLTVEDFHGIYSIS